MKSIYTLIALLVFAAAFSTDTFAQKRGRNGIGVGRTTPSTPFASKKTGITGDWDGDGKDTVGIAVDPRDSSGNTYYTGSANGGIWKTSNARTRTKTVGQNETITVGAAQSISVGANQSETVGGSRRITDGTSNTMMSIRVDTGNMKDNSLIATTYGRGNARRSSLTLGDSISLATGSAQRGLVQGNYIGTNAVGTYSTHVGPNVRKN